MPETTCSIPTCPNVAKAKGWCRTHLSRYYRHGDPLWGDDLPPVGTAGVYSITCLANGWVYVGSSHSIRQRWTTHKSWLRNGTHNVPQIQADWNRYGESAFEFTLLADVEAKVRRYQVEQQYIDAQMAKGDCYNTSASATVAGGYRFTPEQCQRVSDGLIGKPKSEEHKANLWRDREVTPEFREQMAANGRKGAGRPKSAETRAKMSDRQKGSGNPAALLTVEQVAIIKRRLLDGESGRALAREFGMSEPAISNIKKGKRWAEVAPAEAGPSPAVPAPRAPEAVPAGDQLSMFT